MPRLIIYTKSRLPDEVVTKLAEELDKRVANAEIRIVDAKRFGYGVTWWEVVLIFIATEVSKKVIGEVTEGAIEWAKTRFKEEGSQRPKFISLFGPEGIPLGAKAIKPSGEIEDKEQANEGSLLKNIEAEIDSEK
jgi:hypothetical protein